MSLLPQLQVTSIEEFTSVKCLQYPAKSDAGLKRNLVLKRNSRKKGFDAFGQGSLTQREGSVQLTSL